MNIQKWTIDPDHSDVQFKIKYMVISSVTGAFTNFHGGATITDNNVEASEVHFSLDVNSINTNQQTRDTHLRSADFFNAAEFPHITFQSMNFRKIKGDKYALTGHLHLKGVTKPIELIAEYGGRTVDMNGREKIGFEVTGAISRWEFGLTNPVLERGGILLGEEVNIEANILLTVQND